MERRTFLQYGAMLSASLIAGTANAQFQFENPDETQTDAGPRLGESKTQRWKTGIKFFANNAAIDGVRIAAPIPLDWFEQRTQIVEEHTEPGFKLTY
ncbi:MAG: hypothetical protein LBU65_16090, partial [Planctomycetaceae bacterium]|nr:hypothetical protein [Planctomycetaceae bacterium]